MKVILFFLNNVLGWSLVVIGVLLLVLPGPGLLLIFVGMIFLSQCYGWARRLRHYLREKSGEALFSGVKTLPRFLMSLLSGLAIFACGLYIFTDPTLPRFVWFSIHGYEFGPKIPAAGYSSGSIIMASALLTLGALCYSRVLSRIEKSPNSSLKSYGES